VFLPLTESFYGSPESLPFSFVHGLIPEVSLTQLLKGVPVVTVERVGDAPVFPFVVEPGRFSMESSVPGKLVLDPVPGTVLNAGSQLVEWTFVPADQRLYRQVSGALPVMVQRAEAEIVVAALSTVFSAAPQEVEVTTVPAGLPVQVQYPGGVAPTGAGVYPVQLEIDTEHYFARKEVVWVIEKAPVTIHVAGAVAGVIERRVDQPGGLPTVSTEPQGKALTFAFSDASGVFPETPSSVVPVEIGSYMLKISHESADFKGERTVRFQVLPQTVAVEFAEAVEGRVTRVFSGEAQPLPVVKTTPAEVRVGYRFHGTQNDGSLYGPTAEPPTRAGSYEVTATVDAEELEGAATVAFEVQRAPLLLEERNPIGKLAAGQTVDLGFHFRSNAPDVGWRVADASAANELATAA
jgi:hypothetical protein